MAFSIPIFLLEDLKLNKKTFGKWLIPVVIMLSILILFKLVFLIGYVPTESMEPTIEKGSYIVGMRIYSELEVGDVIIFRHDGRLLVKRIAAIGGDVIERNGVQLTVPCGCYYVLGDNVQVSYDSRYWENPFVKVADIIAKLY